MGAMGYNITIGEMDLEIGCEPGCEVYVLKGAKHAEHADAPRDSTPTSGTNGRWPSYTGWGDFLRDTDLEPDFRDRIMGEHPGCYVLTQEDLGLFEAVDEGALDNKYNIERLRWLVWWTRWALENCKVPVLANT